MEEKKSFTLNELNIEINNTIDELDRLQDERERDPYHIMNTDQINELIIKLIHLDRERGSFLGYESTTEE